MKLTTTDLQALSELYAVSATQLMAPPVAAEMVKTLDRAQTIIDGMDLEILEQWLSIGERLKRSR